MRRSLSTITAAASSRPYPTPQLRIYLQQQHPQLQQTQQLHTSTSVMAPEPIPLPAHVAAALGLPATQAAFREGSATIAMPKADAAFLNPVQEYNRDLSTLAIRAWAQARDVEKRAKWQARLQKEASCKRKEKKRKFDHQPTEQSTDAEATAVEGEASAAASDEPRPYVPRGFTLFEALSATGLRSIRYAREIPLLKWVLANDLLPSAVADIRRNVALNFPASRPIEDWVPEGSQKAATEAVMADGEAAAKSVPSAPSAELNEDDLMDLENAAAAGAAASTSAAQPSLAIHPDCKVRISEADATDVLYTHRSPAKRFDVVDLDPYGSATPFIDGAVQAVADGGLLCVTCTDLAVLAGSNYPEKAYSAYGGAVTRNEFSHEVALRLVMHSVASAAARYGRTVTPLLSLSIDFYLRIFVHVDTKPVEVKRLASKEGTVATCSNCTNWDTQLFGRVRDEGKNIKYSPAQSTAVGSNCDECGGRYHIAGPMWFGPIHDPEFCKEMLVLLDEAPERFGTASRIRGMVTVASEELVDAPFYFTPSRISGTFQCSSPPLRNVVSALLNAGFDVSRSHCAAGSLKTNATRKDINEMIRSWIQAHPVKMENIKAGSPATALLAKQATRSFDFTTEHERTKRVLGEGTQKGKVVKYQMNPLPNWGPGTAAKGDKRKREEEQSNGEVVAVTQASTSVAEAST